MFHFQKIASFRIILHKNEKLYKKNFIFPRNLLKTEFVANDQWQQAPGFDLLHHICDVTCQNQTNVGICHLPEINSQIILEENIIFYAN